MIRAIARTIGFTTITALSLAATTALAQDTRVSGTVSSIDTATRTIYFTDGTALQLKPGTVVTVNGREVAFEALTPGSNATVVAAAPGTRRVVTQTGQSAAGVTGTVARVDRQNGVITLQDGRAIKLSSQSLVWQAAPIDTIQPGAQIYVPNAQPLAMAPQQQSVVAAPPPVAVAPQRPVDSSVRMGTVRSVDRNSSLIRLNDGTFVKVLPTTRMQSAGRTMTISELRPGDQVAVWPYGRSYVAETATVPRGDDSPASALKADYIEVTRAS